MQTLISTLRILACLGILTTGVLASGAYQFYQEESPNARVAISIAFLSLLISLSLFFLAELLTKSTY